MSVVDIRSSMINYYRNCSDVNTSSHKGIGTGLAGPVLARPLFLKVRTKFYFTKSR